MLVHEVVNVASNQVAEEPGFMKLQLLECRHVGAMFDAPTSRRRQVPVNRLDPAQNLVLNRASEKPSTIHHAASNTSGISVLSQMSARGL